MLMLLLTLETDGRAGTNASKINEYILMLIEKKNYRSVMKIGSTIESYLISCVSWEFSLNSDFICRLNSCRPYR